MTDPMELVGRMETEARAWAGTRDEDDTPMPHELLLTEAAACIREMVERRPIETAPLSEAKIIVTDGPQMNRVHSGCDIKITQNTP